ncbi:tyrosine-type recombinase/integrase [Zavarzinella formosa]|uniref:tyrosine-type recombinase/integrase n=1 Tax=Zavarzinella formosa TaxID=360055 RepID=UPI0012FCEFEC|nr:site-specific integrase [Zavarzinella formosa]
MPAPDNKPELITVGDLSLTIEQWAAKNKLKPATIRSRISLGWEPAVAVSKPPDRRFSGGGRHPVAAPKPCPKFKRHPGGQGYARWKAGGKRRFRYFGIHGSDEADQAYARFAREWAAGQIRSQPPPAGKATLKDLAAGYLAHAKLFYRKNGKVTGEYGAIKTAMDAMLRAGNPKMLVPAYEPADLEGCMSWMLEAGWMRETINGNAGRIVRAFKWAVTRKMCSAEVPATLALVPRYKRGQTSAPERAKTKPIPWPDVEKTFPHLYPGDEARRSLLEDMLRVHWLTGMRPQTICGMRPCDLDRSGPEWKYEVSDIANKTAHRDQDLVVWIGPQAQAIMSKYLAGCPEDRPVFALPPSPKRPHPWGLSRNRYCRIIVEACRRAGVEPWTPRRMRHTHARHVRQSYESLEAARLAIGDTPEVTAAVYTDPTELPKRRIARELG